MVTRLSGVQLGLQLYKWLTKLDSCEAGVQLSITCMINCYQLIITNAISEKKKQLGQTSPVGTMSKAKNLEISQFFLFQGKWFLQWLLWSISSNHIWGNCNGYA